MKTNINDFQIPITTIRLREAYYSRTTYYPGNYAMTILEMGNPMLTGYFMPEIVFILRTISQYPNHLRLRYEVNRSLFLYQIERIMKDLCATVHTKQREMICWGCILSMDEGHVDKQISTKTPYL